MSTEHIGILQICGDQDGDVHAARGMGRAIQGGSRQRRELIMNFDLNKSRSFVIQKVRYFDFIASIINLFVVPNIFNRIGSEEAQAVGGTISRAKRLAQPRVNVGFYWKPTRWMQTQKVNVRFYEKPTRISVTDDYDSKQCENWYGSTSVKYH